MRAHSHASSPLDVIDLSRDAAGVTDDRSRPIDEIAANRPEYWSQETLGEANGSLFKVAKGIGATEWHSHDDQDEVFVVTHGRLIVELRDREVVVETGELFIVPRGVEHRPRAESEARFLIVGSTITSTAAGGRPAWAAEGGRPPLQESSDA